MMRLTKKSMVTIMAGLVLVILLLMLSGCGVIRDLPRYW